MAPFSWSRWLRSLFRPRVTNFRKRDSRLAVESLETRLAPATFTWTGRGTNASWSNGANWSTGTAPVSSDLDNIVFPAGAVRLNPLFDIAGLKINSLTVSGSGYLLKANGGLQLTLGDPAVSGSGSFVVGAGVTGGTLSMDMALAGPGGSRQFFTVGTNSTFTITSKLSGTTGAELTKEGTGTLILEGDDSGFTGPFTLDNSAGVVQITNPNALGSGPQVTVGPNSQLQVNGTLAPSPATGITVANNLILNGPGPNNTGALLNFGGTNFWSGPVQLDSDVTLGSSAGTLTISGSVGDLGAGHGITKEGVGTIALSGDNTYRGVTTVNNGVLDVESNTALGLGDGTTASGTVVNSIPAEQGTLQIDGNITVSNELLTLNGGGFNGLGALYGHSGNSNWAGDVILGSTAPNGSNVFVNVAAGQSVTVSGLNDPVLAPVGTPAISNPNGDFSLTKIGHGTLIFTTANSYTSATIINDGILEIEDSAALGSAGDGTTVNNGGTLELAVDGIPDSVLTGDTARLLINEPIAIAGDGFNNLGAIYSASGINTWASGINLFGGTNGIGVAAAAVPTGAPYSYPITGSGITLDDSLTVTGIIDGGSRFFGLQELDKLGLGQLILPNANTYEGQTVIKQGFVTVESPQAFGSRVQGWGDAAQPFVTVDAGAALHLLSLSGGLNLPYNLVLAGSGVTAPAYPLVNRQGALMSLAGINTVSGNVVLNGPAGIGVEQIYNTTGGDPNFATNPASQLTLTGQQSDASQGAAPGGIIKRGTQRLIIQGPGTYTGNVDVQQGVLLDQDDTGLGSGAGTTTVESGAALELANGIAANNGGIASGIIVYGEHLILNGPGNATFGDTALNVLTGTAGPTSPVNDPIAPSDDMWRGPVTLGSSATITVPPNARLSLYGSIDDGGNVTPPRVVPPPADLTLTGGGELDLQGANSYRGITNVNQGVLGLLNSQALGGTGVAEVDTVTLTAPVAGSTQFNLTFNGVTTASPITYTGTTADAAAIQAALNNLSMVQGLGGVVTVSQIGLVFTVTFGGGLAGFPQQFTGAVVAGKPGGLTVGNVTAGTGGTVVANGASLSLQGSLTIAGEPLKVQGSGVGTAPSVPAQWFPVGPAPVQGGQVQGTGPVSGRVTGVATDPSDAKTIYISTAGGGAWKTIDGGNTWVPLFDGYAGTFSGAIAVDPSDPRVIYLGTGEANNSGDSFYGTGVYKSTDSGRTWTLLTSTDGSNPLNGQAISRILVDPTFPNVIYVSSSYYPVATAVAAGSPVNAPQAGETPGVYRYDGSNWFNLTDVVSPDRSPANPGGAANTPPNKPGPDDDFRILFPLTAGTWSDLSMANGVLYAALGTYTGDSSNVVPRVSNAVFRCANPTSNTPIWDVGNGAVDSETGTEFPNGAAGGAVNGNIKIVAVRAAPGDLNPLDNVIYASIATPYPGATNTSFLLAIEKSTDGGQTWAAVAVEPTNYMGIEGYQDNTITASDPNTVYVGGEELSTATHTTEVFFTTDGGATWNDFSIGSDGSGLGYDEHAMALDASGNLIVGSGVGVWKYLPTGSTALGTWKDLTGNLAIGSYHAVDVAPHDLNVAIAGSQDAGTSLFSGGQQWTWVNQGQSNGGEQVAINPNNPNVMYAAGDGVLFESTSGGAAGSWVPIFTPLASNFSVPFVLDPLNTQRLLVGDGPLEQSLDGGASFQNDLNSPTGNSPVTALAIAGYQGAFVQDPAFPNVTDQGSNTYDPNTIYVTNGSRLWVTKNDGLTWFDRTSNLSALAPNMIIQSITVDPRNRDTAYVVSSSPVGYDHGHGRVFVTTNAGQTWLDITQNLPDVPTWALTIDPRSGELYVGNDLGVFASSNGGASWARFGAGLPEVQVTDIVLNQSFNTLTVSTYGRGIFQLFLDTTQANGGALAEPSGSSVWTGPVLLTGPTTFGASGTQALRNGLATAQVNILGTIADLVPGANNYVTKTGLGNVVFSGTNIYGGVTEVVQGALIVHNPLALGSPNSPTIVDAGAALQLESSIFAEPLTIRGNGPAPGFNGHGTGALENVSNNNTYTGPITLADDTTIGVDSGSTLTLSPTAVISDGGAGFALTKELTGTLILQAANTYGGNTGVVQGVLNIQNAAALGIAGTTTTVFDGAQLELQGGIDVSGEKLRLTGTGIFNTGAVQSVGGANVWEGDVILARDAGFSPDTTPPNAVGIGVLYNAVGDSLTFNGPISQIAGAALGVTKVGLGTAVFDDTNSYAGVTTVSEGTLRIQQGGALGTPSNGTVVLTGAALEIDGDPTNLGTGIDVAGEALAVNGNGAPEVQAITVTGGTGTTFTLTFNGRSTSPLPSGATASQVQAALSGLGAGGVTVTQVGNTYLVIFTGTLSGADQGPITAGGTANPTVTQVRDGGQGALSNLTGTNTWTGPITLQTSSALGAAAGSSLLASGVVQDPTPIAVPAPSLTKVGAGTIALSSANTYTGTTFVNGGVLNVQNDFGLGTPVNEVQTITVTGSISGSFALRFLNSPLSAPLSGNPAATTAAMVQGAINGLLTGLGISGSVHVAQSANVYTVTFDTGAVAGLNQPQLVASFGGGTVATVATAQDGSNGTVVASGGTLQVQGGITVSNEPLTLTGPGFNNLGALDSSSGTNIWDGPITLAGDPAIGADTGSALFIDQVISESSATPKSPLVKVGAGVVFLTGASSNTYTGLTTVANGTLELDKTGGAVAVPAGLTVGTGALPPGSATAQLELSNEIANGQALTVNSDGVFDLNGNTQSAASLTMTGGAVDLTGAASRLTVTGAVTATSDGATPPDPATVSGAGTLALTAAAPIITVTGSGLPSATPDMVIASPITTPAAGGITKAGNGVLQVTSNDPTLPVTVTAGRVLADGNEGISETFGAVTLRGGTLGGGGSVVSVTPVSGTIQPAEDSATPTTLTTTTTAAQTWNPSTTLSLVLNDAAPGHYSVLSLNGNLNINGAQLAGFAGLGVHQGDTFVVVQTTGTISGTFASPGKDPNTGLPVAFVGGEKFDVQYLSNEVVLTRVLALATVTISSSAAPSVFGQGVTFSATVTPEPGAAPIPGTDLVTFTLDSNPIPFTTTTPGGVALFNPANFYSQPLSVGLHTITATFIGDNTFAPSAMATIPQTVNKASSSFTLTADTTKPVPGQAVTLTATFLPVSPGAGVPSGQAVFAVDTLPPRNATLPDNTPSNGTVTLLPNGQALLVLNGLALGQHKVRVSYAGDTNFKGVASVSDFIVTVLKGSAGIQVAANPSSSTYGQTVAFTATVSGPVTPTGTVTFYHDAISAANQLGAATLLDGGGQATLNTNLLNAGSHTIIVFYSGNTSYNPGTTTTPLFTVIKATTETVASSSLPLTAFGQFVTLSASLSVDLPGQGTPGGTVSFFDNTPTPAKLLGTGTVNASGVAILSINTLGIGTHNVSATYNGNINFLSSSSNTIVQTVQVGVIVAPSEVGNTLNQAVAGQTISIQATVKGQAPGNPVPPDGEMVTFTDIGTGNTLGSAPLSHGTATLTGVTGLAVGQHVIQASYGGDTGSGGNFLPGTGKFTLTVNRDATTTKVVSSATPGSPTYGTDVTFTISVSANAPGSGTPTGTVTLFDGPPSNNRALGSNTLSNGSTTIDTTAINAGAHTIYAVYSDDANFAPSFGTVAQSVSQDNSTTALLYSTGGSPPPGDAFFSVPTTLTATVTANLTGNPVPSGTVSFSDGSHVIGTGTVNASGLATLVVKTLTVGSHSLVATYLTSVNFRTSASAATPLTIIADDTNTTLTSSAEPSIVGQSVVFTATVTPANGGTITPTGTVQFWDGPVGTGRLLGSAALTAGKAALAVTTLPFGHGQTINAVYVGNAAFNTSTGTATQDVLYNSGVVITTSKAGPVYGQDFTLTATVYDRTAGATGNFNGTVTFFDGGKPIGTPVTVVSGGPGNIITATLADSSLATPLGAGAHSITAKYAADPALSDFTNAASPAFAQTVAQDTTTAALTSDLAPPYVYGTPLTFTATVTANLPGSGLPTGKVGFYDGTALVGTAGLDNTGTAFFPDNTLGTRATAHTITAKYLGDANFKLSAASNAVSVLVSQATTSTAISATDGTPPASADTAVFGEAVTFSATVTAVTGGGVPAGTVSFSDLSTGTTLGSTTKITMLTPTSGVATLVVSNLAVSVNPHEIAATFGNTANYAGSTTAGQAPDADWFVTVGKADTSVTVNSSVNPSVVGQPVSFSATVAAVAPGGGVPTGSVQFFIDGSSTPFSTAALKNGVAVSTAISSLSAGGHQITATYLPGTNPNFNGSDNTAAPFTQNVQTQTLTSLLAPTVIKNAPVGTFFTFAVTGLDQQKQRDFSAPGGVKVSILSGPTGAVLSGKSGDPLNPLTFNFASGIATVDIALSKAGTYNLLLDAGNGITAIVTVITAGRQS